MHKDSATENLSSSRITVKEFFQLLGISFIVQLKNFVEFLRVAFRYYSNWNFCKIDLSLLLIYLFNSPYGISKKFLQKRGAKDIYAYGETPLSTCEEIAKKCQLSATDTLFELGCGRGRSSFWLNAFVKCNVVGIDYVPEFIARANDIKARFTVSGVTFRQEDFLATSLDGATAIYLYGTNLSDEDIVALVKRFEKLPAGTKIITISFPLTDYTSVPFLKVMKRFPVKFPWGETDAYLHMI
ncbi:MAG: class I SAM-dependent methyltransferase [Parachlamydiaceae bacterium]|nr:class I SAM-dependent methyltransferase [Parachlamydiaceae bacterium]